MRHSHLIMAAAVLCAAVVSCSEKGPEEKPEIHDVLAAPTGVAVPAEEVGSYSFVLTWNAVDNADVASYTVAWKENSASSWNEKTSYSLKADITELEMLKTYEAKVRANSSAGEQYNSPWSSSVSVTTIQSIDVDVPTGLKIDAVTSTSISVSWDAVENAKGYVVSCKPASGDEIFTEVAENKAEVTGLAIETKYAVSVKTCSKSGEAFDSAYCTPIDVETLTKSYGITCSADFIEFLNGLAADGSDGTGGEFKDAEGVVNIRADIDLSALESIPETLTFAGKLNGNGHKISNLKIEGESAVALFPVLSAASIQDLTIDETCSFTIKAAGQTDFTNAGAFAATTYGGTEFIKCINKAKVSGAAYMGGILGSYTSKDGTVNFTDCENYGEITVPAGQEIAKNMFLGGVCGYSETKSMFTGCKNKGVISSYNGDYNSYCCVGGIIGMASDCKWIECVNGGELKLAVKGASIHWMGGIVARAYRGTLTKCTTTNEAKFEYTPATARNRELYVGGCCGWMGGTASELQTITDCTNNADITIKCSTDMTAKPACIGGVVGFLATTGTAVTGCVNTGKIETEIYANSSGAAGIVGYANVPTSAAKFGSENSKISSCTNYGGVSCTQSVKASAWIHVAGVVAEVKTCYTAVENCINEGDVIADMISRSQAAGIVCESNTTITGCTNKGSVTCGPAHIDYYSSTAGIVARMVNSAAQTVKGCVNEGRIAYCGNGLSAANVNNGIVSQGGIVAFLQYGDVVECENYGTVLGKEHETYVNGQGSIAGWASVGAVSKITDCKVGGSLGTTDNEASDFGESKATALTADTYSTAIFGKEGKTTEVSGCVFATK